MICLDDTDTLEGGASVTNVVDYTVHGYIGTAFANIAQGQLSDTDPTVLYTADQDISIVSVVFVNTHSAAVTVNLYLDPANAGTPRRLIPKALSLGIGYSMHFDGAKLAILDASGALVMTPVNVSDVAYNESTWNGVTTVAPSKNAVRDEFEIRQPLDATLTSIATLGTVANKIIYTTGVDTWAESKIMASGVSLLSSVTAPTTLATGVSVDYLPIMDASANEIKRIPISGLAYSGITEAIKVTSGVSIDMIPMLDQSGVTLRKISLARMMYSGITEAIKANSGVSIDLFPMLDQSGTTSLKKISLAKFMRSGVTEAIKANSGTSIDMFPLYDLSSGTTSLKKISMANLFISGITQATKVNSGVSNDLFPMYDLSSGTTSLKKISLGILMRSGVTQAVKTNSGVSIDLFPMYDLSSGTTSLKKISLAALMRSGVTQAVKTNSGVSVDMFPMYDLGSGTTILKKINMANLFVSAVTQAVKANSGTSIDMIPMLDLSSGTTSMKKISVRNLTTTMGLTGATTELPVGGGVGVAPVWTTATGSGAPVRATSPTLVTPALGTPTSGDLQNCTVTTVTTKGVVELATNAEVAAFTDETRAVTPEGLGYAMAGLLGYGVEWDEDDASPTLTRLGTLANSASGASPGNSLLPIQAQMRRCILSDAGVVQYYLSATDSTLKVNGTASVLDGTDGQVMVEIPKFAYKYAYNADLNQHQWWISPVLLPGFEWHLAFYKNGAWVDHRYIGAYEGIGWDASTVAAQGTITMAGIAVANETFVIDSQTFTWKAARAVAGEVTIGATAAEAVTNIVTAVTADLATVTAVDGAGDTVVVTAVTGGTVGNNIVFTEASTNMTVDGTGTLGATTTGADADYIDNGNVAATGWRGTTIDTANDKLSSVSGKNPITAETRAEFRAIAANRGTGWRQQDFYLSSAIQLLYVTEYASWNSQSMIGMGRTQLTGGTWVQGSYIKETGLSNGNGNGTNAAAYAGDADDVGAEAAYMTYRGIENFFGNIWKWVDGFNINDGIPYVSNVDTDFADDTATGTGSTYARLLDINGAGITLPQGTNDYQSTLEQIAGGFLPSALGGSSSTYITDYYYQAAAWRVAMLGGYASDALFAGVAFWSLLLSSAFDDASVGGRLCF